MNTIQEDKFRDYLNNDTKIEIDSKYNLPSMPRADIETIRFNRQLYRIIIFFLIIFVLFFIILKSFVDDLTIINMSGLNFFNLCRFFD